MTRTRSPLCKGNSNVGDSGTVATVELELVVAQLSVLFIARHAVGTPLVVIVETIVSNGKAVRRPFALPPERRDIFFHLPPISSDAGPADGLAGREPLSPTCSRADCFRRREKSAILGNSDSTIAY